MESAKAMLDALVRRVGCPWGILLAAGLLWGGLPSAWAYPPIYSVSNVNGHAWCYTVTNGESTIENFIIGYYGDTARYVCAVEPPPSGLLHVPSFLKGYPVVGISPNAFLQCTNMSGVVLPDSLRKLSSQAFSGCTSFENIHVTDLPRWCEMDMSGYIDDWRLYWRDTNAPGSTDTEIEDLVIPEGVEVVATNVFRGCRSLRSVTFPRSLKRIEAAAFRDCPNLTNLVFRSESLEIQQEAFYGCTNLPPELVIPDGVTQIGAWAFYGCSNLVKVSIGASVTNIDTSTGSYGRLSYSAFAGCPSIVEATFPPCAKASAMFPESYTNIVKAAVSPGAASVGDAMFNGCVALEEVAIPDTVEVVGSEAFRACSVLEEAVLPPGVETIGSMAFYGCTNLARIDLPVGLKGIGRDAFEGCSRLTEIVVPDGVTDIGGEAFGGCTGVTNVVLPLSITNIHMKYTYGEGFGAFMSCSSIVEATVPPYAPMRDLFPAAYTNIAKATVVDGAINMCASMFSGCSGLREVSIPATVEALEDYAFWYCTGLEEVELPAGVKCIGNYAFGWCTNLVRAGIPSGVNEIGSSAFSSCSRLVDVVFSGNAPECGTGIYSSTPAGLTSWVRQGSTGWDGDAESTALPATWQGRPIRRWGTAEYEAAGEAVPDTRTETGGVPLVWLDERDLARDGDYEAAAAADAANGRPVWECYVAGLDPKDPEAEFKVRLWFEDGAVHLGWTPDWSDAENGSGRTYRLMGKKSMDAEWEDVLEPADLSAKGWRYFRVGVSLPPEQGE